MTSLFRRKPQQVSQGDEIGKEAEVASTQERPLEPQPRTRTEAIVQEAPSVVPELQQVTEQKEVAARATIEMLENARRDKGNFCVTLGTGDRKAVVLVAPIKRTWQTKIGDKEYDYTLTDYVVISPQGPRRVSFITEVRKGTERFGEEGKQNQRDFEGALTSAIKQDGVISGAEFRDWGISQGSDRHEMSISVPIAASFREEEKRLFFNSRYRDDEYSGEYKIAPIREESIVEQAVRASLKQTQSPIQAQMGNVRQEIDAMTGVRKGLT